MEHACNDDAGSRERANSKQKEGMTTSNARPFFVRVAFHVLLLEGFIRLAN